jgi:enterochelin esterase-like enzyme
VRHRRRRRRTAASLVAAAAAVWLVVGLVQAFSYVHHYALYRGFEPPHDPAGINAGRLERVRFYSPAVRAWKYYLVYLPPGYARDVARRERLPVLYLLHGGPSIPEDFIRVGAVGVTYDVELAAGRVRPMLIVMPYGRVHGGPPDTEWSNTRIGRYEDLVLDVVRAVDRRWPTLADRRHRMLAGYSTGGYAAANIALHHLGVFGSFESWSGFFVEDRSEAFKHEPAQNLRRNSPALYVSSLARQLHRHPLIASLYQGDRDHEKTFMMPFALRLRAAGAHVTFAFYFGRHDWRIWRYRMKYELQWASRVLGGPAVVRAASARRA